MSKLEKAFNIYGTTENGATTYNTTLNPLVDLFFLVWAARNTNIDIILKVWNAAVEYSKVDAYKILFYARDRDYGAGERRVFRTIFSRIPADEATRFLTLVPFYGRWDDLWLDENNEVHLTHIDYIADSLLVEDGTGSVNLLAKWLPRKGILFSALSKKLYLSYKGLRKLLVSKTRVVETLMSEGRFDEIKFEQVPSRALLKYSTAFYNKTDHFAEFLSSKKAKSAYFYPYDIYRKKDRENKEVLQSMWKQIQTNLTASKRNFIPVVDVSGSMQGTPMEMAVSLGVFLAERNTGIFNNEIITFSKDPRFLKMEKTNIVDKFKEVDNYWGYNTDLHKTFSLLLERAKKAHLTNEEMPEALVIISDMEFDQIEKDPSYWNYDSSDNGPTNFEKIKAMYEENNYTMPFIIFWNVASRNTNFPSLAFDNNVVLFSGSNPKNIDKIINFSEDMVNPEAILKTTVLTNPRYQIIEQIV